MKGQFFRVATMMILATSACTPSKNSDTGVLKIHFPKVKLILDPHQMEDAYSMAAVLQLHRGLLRYTPAGDWTHRFKRG